MICILILLHAHANSSIERNKNIIVWITCDGMKFVKVVKTFRFKRTIFDNRMKQKKTGAAASGGGDDDEEEEEDGELPKFRGSLHINEFNMSSCEFIKSFHGLQK